MIQILNPGALGPSETDRGCLGPCWIAAPGDLAASAYYRGGQYPIARAAWLMAEGPIPDGLWVLHHCDVANCVRIDHLYLGTYTDNIADRVRRGRHNRNPSRPLPLDDKPPIVVGSLPPVR